MKTSFDFLTKTNFQELKKVLEKNKYEGFVTIEELTKHPNLAPNENGVYMIIKKSRKDPLFHEAKLNNKWVKNTSIIYIGKAGGKTSKLKKD